MLNTLRTRNSVLAAAFTFAFSPLGVAAEPVESAEQPSTKGAGTGPKTSVQATRQIATPVLDVDKMSEEEVRAALKRLQSQQGTARGATRTIRFNDGSDPTYYAEGDKIIDAQGRATNKTAKGGEVKSARDSGTLSIYGFGRNPISLYPSQWLELCAFMPDVVNFIADNVEHIDEYIQEHSKGRSDRVNQELVLQLQEWFTAPEELKKARTLVDELQTIVNAPADDEQGDGEGEVNNLADEVGGEG